MAAIAAVCSIRRSSVVPGDFGSAPLYAQSTQFSDAAGAATAGVEECDLPQALKNAVLQGLQRNPEASLWAGQEDHVLFAVSSIALPSGSAKARLLPVWLRKTTARATAEVLRTKSLLNHYRSARLDDAATLAEAFRRIAMDSRITGRIRGLNQHAVAAGDYAVALVYAPSESVVASGTSDIAEHLMRTTYRDVMHEQARRLMKQQQWSDALSIWQHLHIRRLVGSEVCLDAARCFVALERETDALHVLEESLTTLMNENEVNWTYFEQAGDLAAQLDVPQAEEVAISAYSLAVRRFSLQTR